MTGGRPTTAVEHHAKAERLLDMVADTDLPVAPQANLIAVAQVHATLALALFTRDAGRVL